MTKFRKLLLIAVAAICVSCNSSTGKFDFSKSELVKLNDIELNASQIQQVQAELNSLGKRKKTIFSKPTHLITFQKGGEERYISIFEKEDFVFKGYYLDAWTDRMKDSRSNGYKLSKDLEDLIEKIKAGA